MRTAAAWWTMNRGALSLATEFEPAVAEYRRGGYIFTIEVRVRDYPWATFKYWAKVTSVARADAPATPIPLDELPFTPVHQHGASEAEAAEQVTRQIDESLS